MLAKIRVRGIGAQSVLKERGNDILKFTIMFYGLMRTSSLAVCTQYFFFISNLSIRLTHSLIRATHPNSSTEVSSNRLSMH